MHVLFVCTGNICRSPAAQFMLASQWSGEAGLSVSSAGVSAMVGVGVHSPVRSVLAERGIADPDFRGRQLTPHLISGADLVLVMTREHRSRVVSQQPAALRRTFTLREFARVAQLAGDQVSGDTVAVRLKRFLPVAARMRGLARVDVALDDISDPYQRGEAACLRMVDEVEAALDDVVARVGLGRAA